MGVQNYRDLIAWQKAMVLAERVYRASAALPKADAYGLMSQLRRAALSVPSNIAEGQGRGATKEYVRFLRIARGSVQELETQLILAQRLGLIPHPESCALLEAAAEVGRLVAGLARALAR